MAELARYNLVFYSPTRRWMLKPDSFGYSIKSFATKHEALDFIPKRLSALGGLVQIQNEDGTLEEERTYARANPARTFPR